MKLRTKGTAALFKQSGVPQEGSLGPVLFMLYTCNVPRCVQNCTFHQHANGCQQYLSNKPAISAGTIFLIRNIDDLDAHFPEENSTKLPM
ncbi:hypothetical protein J6590_103710 [Homalodisca vitripennis]|nr:hypothetical protein J6590_103710 [Homalodisca vitripennis]